ncbi:MAG: DEAD/DEAH box helicase [Bacteroidales bacterium]|nr:DEAD/DEAH box helicase [Bacteroidales bacterium]MCF8456306.1 DEAD/DEAH box helicase [Bacteroidales bacterium]
MDSHLAIILYKHRNFGYVASAFLIKLKEGKVFYLVEERIDPVNLDHYNFTTAQQTIVRKCDDMSDKTIVRIFDKKKKGFTSFFKGINKDYVQTHIQSYIEKRLSAVLDLVREHEIPLYMVLERSKTLFPEDQLVTSKQSAEALFNFIKTQDSFRYYLSIDHPEKDINLTGKTGQVLVNFPCYLVLENHLYHFEDIDGKKLMPFFEKEFITIPKSAEKKYFESFVLLSLKKYKVKTTGFVYEKIQPKPAGILSLEKNLNNTPVFILKFRYAPKVVFNRSSLTASYVDMKEENGDFSFSKIFRDYDEERTIAYLLAGMGLLEFQLGQLMPPGQEAEKGSVYHFVAWLTENREELEKNNISIEQKDIGKKFSLYKAELKFEVKTKIDWFDIHAMVTCGDYSFPFIEFRQYILKGIKEFPLPNGEFIALPDDWFEKYDDFFFHAKSSPTGLQLKRQHLGVLRKAYIGSASSYIEKIQDMGNLFTKPVVELPDKLNAQLRSYQNEGFSWLYFLQQNNFGGCLADDMGLGKTLQTLALLLKTIKTKGKLRPGGDTPKSVVQLSLFDQSGEANKDEIAYRSQATLIVMPTSLIHNWENEILKFTPSLRVYKYTGPNRATYRSVHKTFYNYDIILSSYGVVRNDVEYLRDYKFFYIILDESQYIKNPESKSYRSISQLDGLNRLVLTGTPIENSLKDLWAQMNFINPGLLGNFEFFNKRYLLPIEKARSDRQRENLKTLIQPFILRRTKQEVAKDLPDITDQHYFVSMTEEQEELYRNEKNRIRNSIIEAIEQKGYAQSAMYILRGLLRLRQMANHPGLIDEAYINGSGKFEEVCRVIESLIAENHKVLIFSGFVTHLAIYARFFEENNWKYSKLTGQTRNREEVINSFQNDEENRLFLISIKAGGVGLNLTAADYIFILDPWWNPAVELQAISRAHRIGQDKKVFVYRFITENSIEEKIQKLQEKKSKLADVFINSNNPFAQLDQESIMDLLD